MRCSVVWAFVVTWLASTTPAGAQDVRTQAPCSPVVDRTQGNVTINFTGGCTAGITPSQLKEAIDGALAGRAVPPELLDRYEGISRQFGVTDGAVTNFFRILGEKKVAIEDLDAKLREIAAQHLMLLKQTEARAGDDPRVAALKTAAVAAIGTGDYARAQTLLEQAFDADLAEAQKALDAANERYVAAAKTKADVGRLKMAQLQYAAAARQFQAAADLVPVSKALVRAQYLTSAGEAAWRAGDYALAQTGLTEALSIREKALEPEDASVGDSLNNLAVLYSARGRDADAEPLAKRALAISETALGPDHPDVAVRLNVLAVIYRGQGRYADAEPVAKRAVAIGEKRLGLDDAQLAIFLNNLAGIYWERARYIEAEPLFKRALAINEKALGPEHPNVAKGLNNLATLYDLQRRYAEAEPLYTRALSIDEKVLGPEHPDVAIALSNLAAHYKLQGRYGEAEPLLKRANLINEKTLGPEHPGVASGLNFLAILYQASGRSAEAESLLNRALAIDEKALGLDHPDTRAIRRNLELLRQQSAAHSGETSPAKRDR
jgi:tetratricopeptide (TPR) repeat protein